MVKALKIIIAVCAVILVFTGGFIFLYSGNVPSISDGSITEYQTNPDGTPVSQNTGSGNANLDDLDSPPPINTGVKLDFDVKTDGSGNIVGVGKDAKGRFASNYNKIFESGNFQLEFTSDMEWNGTLEPADMVLAVAGENMAIKMKVNTISANVVMRNGKSYLVIPSLLKKADISDNMPAISGLTSLSTTKMKYINSGEETIDGQKLVYEKYSFEDQSARYYYFNNGRLVLIKDVAEDDIITTMKIKAIRTTITDSSIFRVPVLYGTIKLSDFQ